MAFKRRTKQSISAPVGAGKVAERPSRSVLARGNGEDASAQDVSATKRKEDRNLYVGIGFIVLVAVGFTVWLFVSGKAASFFDALARADLWWVLGGAAFFIGFFMLDVACYRVAGMLTGVRLGFLDLLSVAAAGIVFGYLTPGQMGAAPAQIVRLSQVGLKVGDATAVQLTKFFIYQAAVTVFGAVVLVAKSSYFIARFGDLVLVSVLSFVMHLGIMAGLVLVIFFPNLVRRVLYWAVKVGSGHIRLIKDPDGLRRKIDDEVDEYAGSVHAAIRHPGVVGTAVAVTLLQLGCLYCVPYFVIRSFGVDAMDFVTAGCAAAFVQLIMTAVPLPGGTGGAEGGFALFFGPELGASVTAAVVLWRMLTFYLPIIACTPLLGLRSKLTPAQRLEEFGEAHVGYEGFVDAMKIVRRRTVELRDASSGRRMRHAGLKRGRHVYVAMSSAMPVERKAWYRAHRLRRARKTASVRLSDLASRDRDAQKGEEPL